MEFTQITSRWSDGAGVEKEGMKIVMMTEKEGVKIEKLKASLHVTTFK